MQRVILDLNNIIENTENVIISIREDLDNNELEDIQYWESEIKLKQDFIAVTKKAIKILSDSNCGVEVVNIKSGKKYDIVNSNVFNANNDSAPTERMAVVYIDDKDGLMYIRERNEFNSKFQALKQ